MKRFTKIILAICMTLLCVLTVAACDELPKLEKPINLQAVDSVLTWSRVNYASEYFVRIDDGEPIGVNEATQYDLSHLTEPKSYSITVMAKGNSQRFLPSDWSDAFEYTVEPIIPVKLSTPTNVLANKNTKILSYAPVANASGYEIQIDDESPIDNSTNTEYSLSALVYIGTYRLKVRAKGNGTTFVDSDWSRELSVYMDNKLSAPKILDLDENTKKLSYEAVPKANSYLIQIDDLEPIDNGTKTEFDLSFLSNPNLYYIKIQAVGDNITSSNSEWSLATTYSVGTAGLRYDLTEDNEAYIVSAGDATLEERIVIPASYNKKPVVQIAANAFEGCQNLSSILIPSSVTRVGINAFLDTGIWNSAANNSVVYADTWIVGHKGSPSGTFISKSETVGIADSALLNCSLLTSLSLNSSLIHIGEMALRFVSGLSSIVVSSANNTYSSASGCLILTEEKKVILGTKFASIPTETLAIDSYAFYGTELETITIPSKVRSIGSYAFAFCEKLTTIGVPANVKELGENVFDGCTLLDNVTVGGGIEGLPSGTFQDCASLATIVLGKNLAFIGELAFANCISLTSILMPNYITEISQSAFMGCTLLAEVTLSTSLITIGIGAFEDCGNIKNISLPSTLTTISSRAFMGCSMLSSITISANVTTIAADAFNNCSALTIYTEASQNIWGAGFNAALRPIFYNCVLSNNKTNVASWVKTAANMENTQGKTINAPFNYGYEFLGWSISNDPQDTSIAFNAQEFINAPDNTTLYTRWN